MQLRVDQRGWRRLRLTAAVGIAVIAMTAFYLWSYQPDRLLYPVRGIDVSHHQGVIDWSEVAADDVRFAYLKASEGADYIDPRFTTNRRAAQAAGVQTGAYHFFTLCRSGADQARHFLAVSGPARATDLPPVVDLEFGGNCAIRPDATTLQRELAVFVAIVEGDTGRRVVIYATDDFKAAYGAILPDRPPWVRSLFHPPAAATWYLWQYHNAGHIRGIDGRIDLDVYCGDLDCWRAVPGEICR